MIHDERKKVVFVIPSLEGGGAEKVLMYLLQHLNRDFFRPILAVFNQTGFYANQVPDDIVTFNLTKKSPLSFFQLIHKLSRIFQREQPALIVSNLTYANYLILLARAYSRCKIPVILKEHSNLSVLLLMDERFGCIKREIIKRLYPQAERIIAVSQGVKDSLTMRYFPFSHRIPVIYNGVDKVKISNLAKEAVSNPWVKDDVPLIISVGRLTAKKNYPLLLKAVASLGDQTNVRVMILGEGEERSMLEKMTRKLGIYKRVNFMDFQSNPFKYIARATLFVLSSSWEGFPYVISEAMACGTPVISTRCPHGPDEIITDEINGLLIPVGDVDALARAIARLLKDEHLRRRLAGAGRKRAEDFSVEKMVSEYERVFLEVLGVRTPNEMDVSGEIF